MKPAGHQHFSSPRGRSAVTVLELLVAVSLISFIVLALYQMFDRTQVQMRRAVRDVDKFESGRAVVDILRRDLVQLGYVKTIFDAGQGGIATNWGVMQPGASWSAAAFYPAGSQVRQGANAYFALSPSFNLPPAANPAVWSLAAPNFRISSFWDTVNPINFQSGTNYLQVCARDDLFFMYFDPQIRVAMAPNGSIQPGVSYVATNAVTYNSVGRQVGEPFFGLAGVAVYNAGGPAVQVDGGWRAVGYRFASTTNAALPVTAGIGTLYRFEMATLGNDARKMWVAFTNFAPGGYSAQTNVFKRVVDNVVHFKCRAVVNGAPVQVAPVAPAYPSCLLFGTSLPSLVEVELATIDSKIAVQAEAIGTTNYLSQQGDHVQMFRLQVPVRIGVQ